MVVPSSAPIHRPHQVHAPVHRSADEVARDAQQAKARQGRRALATNSREWREMRAAQLRREPLCREHNKRGMVRAACEVDHVDGDDSNNHPSNHQSLCKSCHSRKTARENGGFGRKQKR